MSDCRGTPAAAFSLLLVLADRVRRALAAHVELFKSALFSCPWPGFMNYLGLYLRSGNRIFDAFSLQQTWDTTICVGAVQCPRFFCLLGSNEPSPALPRAQLQLCLYFRCLGKDKMSRCQVFRALGSIPCSPCSKGVMCPPSSHGLGTTRSCPWDGAPTAPTPHTAPTPQPPHRQTMPPSLTPSLEQ